MQAGYLAETMCTAFEALSTASSVANELGRDRVLNSALAERIKRATSEAASIYVQILKEGA